MAGPIGLLANILCCSSVVAWLNAVWVDMVQDPIFPWYGVGIIQFTFTFVIQLIITSISILVYEFLYMMAASFVTSLEYDNYTIVARWFFVGAVTGLLNYYMGYGVSYNDSDIAAHIVASAALIIATVGAFAAIVFDNIARKKRICLTKIARHDLSL